MPEQILASRLYGSWDLTAWRRVASDGTTTYPFTVRPLGQLIYDRSNRVAVLLMHPDWPSGAITNGFRSYGGRFEVSGSDVQHLVDYSYLAEMVGQTLIRTATLDRGLLCLTASATDDPSGRHILEWSRV